MTDDLTAFLDAVDTSAAQLRPQRRWGCGDCGEWEDPDAIAAADTLDVLVGMVRAVLALCDETDPQTLVAGVPVLGKGRIRDALLATIPPTPTAEETR